jgi:protein O-GlcNAc transferase
LATCYQERNEYKAAIDCYERALTHNPNLGEAFANLCHAQLSICDWDHCDINKLIANCEAELVDRPQTEQEGRVRARPILPSVQPFHAMVYPFPKPLQQAIARRYSRWVASSALSYSAWTPLHHRGKKKGKLHIGYVSNNFGDHPISYMMKSILKLHNTDDFTVTCYATSPHDYSIFRNEIEESVEKFRDLSGIVCGDAAREIHGDGVNILVNLDGFTKGAKNEIFALRPCPVQCS